MEMYFSFYNKLIIQLERKILDGMILVENELIKIILLQKRLLENLVKKLVVYFILNIKIRMNLKFIIICFVIMKIYIMMSNLLKFSKIPFHFHKNFLQIKLQNFFLQYISVPKKYILVILCMFHIFQKMIYLEQKIFIFHMKNVI